MNEYETGFKKLPYSLQAEQALLGSLLIDPEQMENVMGSLKPDDFYIPDHKAIFSAMLRLHATSKGIDVVTLISTLENEKVYDRAGAEGYLRTLIDNVPNALNLRDYMNIVLEKSIKRQLIEICGTVSEKAYIDTEKSEDLLELASKKISAISLGQNSKGFSELSVLLDKVYSDLERLCAEPEAFEGISTGFSGLDRVLCGIGSTDFVIVGARPGMGKTSLALNIATNVAQRSGKKVVIFSLEMSDEQLASRILSSTALVASTDMRIGKLSQRDWEQLSHAVTTLSECRILIDDTTGITVSEMKNKLRREKDIALCVIDYLQLLQGEKHTDNRVLEIGDITRNMKLMAKELQIPVLCAAQLSRSVEKNNTTNKRPMMSDLRDSGTIEQDADTILFIYRDEYYKNNGNAKQEPESETPVAEIIVAKNRHGSTGTVKVNWIGKYTTFYSIDDNLTDADAPPEYRSGGMGG
ncbi:MAG: replicative DNA helicase [Clostridia bacterium]|nr:replicative DNA helicase [Clostridia bacterium]